MTGPSVEFAYVAAAAVCAAVAFAIATAQSFMGSRVGTDHPGHVFLIRAIRNNGFRLFVRIPRLLNEAVIAALPLYLHAVFARLGERAMFWAERLLNPAMNVLHIALFAGLLALSPSTASGIDRFFPVLAAVACFAFTPQFYHALSARNFGLSSRGIGLVALTVLFLCAWRVTNAPVSVGGWLIGVAAAFAVWAFSTFAAQAMVILAVLLALIFGRYEPTLLALAGLFVFVAVHPRYALGYLRHTLAFIAAYRREMAPISILARRHSVWRDLVFDIPRALVKGPVSGLRYGYENPVLIVVLLNPLTLAAVYASLAGELAPGLPSFAGEVAIAGLAAMLATSFRATRFLGEPERYVEATAPWSALAAVGWIASRFGVEALHGVAVLFVILAIIQLGLFRVLFRYLSARPLDLAGAEAAISAFARNGVRLASNNEHFTKLFMYNDWDFAYCIAQGQGYAGMTMNEAFARHPVLRPEAFELILRRYRINACVIDRAVSEQPFRSQPADLLSATLLHETPALRVFGLTWRESEG